MGRGLPPGPGVGQRRGLAHRHASGRFERLNSRWRPCLSDIVKKNTNFAAGRLTPSRSSVTILACSKPSLMCCSRNRGPLAPPRSAEARFLSGGNLGPTSGGSLSLRVGAPLPSGRKESVPGVAEPLSLGSEEQFVAEPPAERSSIAIALEWSTTIMVIAAEMVVPALLGHWLDTKFHTRPLFVLVGVGLGGLMATLGLMRIAGGRGPQRP